MQLQFALTDPHHFFSQHAQWLVWREGCNVDPVKQMTARSKCVCQTGHAPVSVTHSFTTILTVDKGSEGLRPAHNFVALLHTNAFVTV
jgi:hypothetical protein